MFKLSVIIPAHNESGSLKETVVSIHNVLVKFRIEHEIVVVDDHSTDGSSDVLKQLAAEIAELNVVENLGPNGFGNAVRAGLENYSGDCVAIMMADLSDDPLDLVRYYHRMSEDGVDCVFGSRFINGGKVEGYPFLKLIINRFANLFIQILIGTRYNDATNAFKLYRRETITGLKPFLSPHFNLTIELSLKAIVRGYSYTIVPNRWQNRKTGISKLRIKEMGSRYFFILVYCLIEKYFSKGDYKKNAAKKLYG